MTECVDTLNSGSGSGGGVVKLTTSLSVSVKQVTTCTYTVDLTTHIQMYMHPTHLPPQSDHRGVDPTSSQRPCRRLSCHAISETFSPQNSESSAH